MNTPAKHLVLSLFSATLLLAAHSGSAANVKWGTAKNITGESDVSLNGDLVYAVNFGGVATGSVPIDVTLNTVTFGGGNATQAQAGRYTISGATNWSRDYAGHNTAPFKNLSSNYQDLLKSYVGSTTDTTLPITLVLQGLTIGKSYEVQIWTNNSRWRDPKLSPSPTQQMITLEGGTGSVVLLSNVADTTGSLGQYVTGTFIAADSTSLTLKFTGQNSSAATLINALQLREIAPIPEAGTCAFIFASCVAAIALLRRRARP